MNKQTGAVSIFVVVFFMLLVTVVTVSFLRLMVNDQQQASNNDLSQSAYDSAQAGVEDAKRTLVAYRIYCSTHTAAECKSAGDADHISSPICNAAMGKAIGTNARTKTPEVPIQLSVDGTDFAALDQAYTCVTMDLQTKDYVGNITANQSQLVPLVSLNAFDRVRVEWFSREDISSNVVNLAGLSSSGQPLYTQGNWPINRPSLMRAQLIQYKTNGFTLASFDTVSGAQTNGATMFLYPTRQAGIGDRIMTDYDQRKTDPADDPDPKDGLRTPTAVSCVTSLDAGGYACSSVLVLPQAVGAPNNADRTAFLRLLPLYNGTHFKVTLWNGPVTPAGTPVDFNGVQPLIDSTGRANDLFRRVQSRVDLFDTTFPYPEGTINITGNFCKDFAVTDTAYIPGSTACTP